MAAMGEGSVFKVVNPLDLVMQGHNLMVNVLVVEVSRPAADGSMLQGSTLWFRFDSELLVARLLVESGADVRYVGTACPRTPYSEVDREWLAARGIHVQYRASLEQDLAALHEFKPDLAIGTTPVVQKAKELSIPSLYFTNLISARPLMGPAGAGSLATVVNAALGNKARFDTMTAFFEGVGTGFASGVWEDVPQDHPEFRDHYKRHLAKLAKARKAQEMV
jgi:chlorophyllide a reductase subunit Y